MKTIIGIIIGAVLALLTTTAIYTAEARRDCKKFEKRLKGDWV